MVFKWFCKWYFRTAHRDVTHLYFFVPSYILFQNWDATYLTSLYGDMIAEFDLIFRNLMSCGMKRRIAALLSFVVFAKFGFSRTLRVARITEAWEQLCSVTRYLLQRLGLRKVRAVTVALLAVQKLPQLAVQPAA